MLACMASLCLLAVDAEKAFDCVDWEFLRMSLQQIGLGRRMLSWIMSLYSSQLARVRTNVFLSPMFPIHKGTRQGSPLSPLLYVLTMNHLAVALDCNQNIGGVSLGPFQTKLALFVDDLLLYVTQPHTSLPSILQKFQRFGTVSKLK